MESCLGLLRGVSKVSARRSINSVLTRSVASLNRAVHQIAEEASTSVGIALFTVGIAGLADTTGFWTADEMSVSRFVMLGVVTGHCGLKQMFFSKLCAYMQVTATVFAVMLFRLGAEQQDWMIVGGAPSVDCSLCSQADEPLKFLRLRWHGLGSRGRECCI
jgi:hypothetical protein